MTGHAAMWLDGARAETLPLPDRGLEFGDGLFETLLLHDGQPVFLDAHLTRLSRGLETLHLPDCMAAIEQDLSQVSTEAESIPWAALRITVTRGGGPRGYAPPPATQARRILQLTPLHRDCSVPLDPAAVGLCAHPLSQQSALAGIKHLNRLDQVLAAAEMQAQGFDEGIMLDQTGRVVSCIAGNLFLVRGDTLLTPPIDTAGVGGTRRSLLWDWAQGAGLEVREAEFSVDDIDRADECFYTNALVGIRPIGRFRERRWETHPVAARLFGVYGKALSCSAAC